MKAFIVQVPFGFIFCDEQKRVVGKTFFPKDPQAAAKLAVAAESGSLPEEAYSLLRSLRDSGYDVMVFENAELAKEAEKRLNVKVEVSKPSEAGEHLRSRGDVLAVELGFVNDMGELKAWTRDVAMEVAKLRVKVAVEKRDLMVAQAIQALDDLEKTLNLFMGRLREWYGIHFPELDRLVEKHETYARLVMKLGNRRNYTCEALEAEEVPKARAEHVFSAAQTSMGADVSDVDMSQIIAFSRSILELYELRRSLEKYIDDVMDEVAPNTKAIVGSLLGARLIAVAGNLKNLSLRPSSTIQVLGAEKALFRSLKTGARPPKHGLIFQHTLLHEAKRWQRGKIARAVAGKLAIAARIDAFGGNYMGDVLKADLDKRIAEIREKYKEPPPAQPKVPEHKKAREKLYREKKRNKRRKNRRAS